MHFIGARFVGFGYTKIMNICNLFQVQEMGSTDREGLQQDTERQVCLGYRHGRGGLQILMLDSLSFNVSSLNKFNELK